MTMKSNKSRFKEIITGKVRSNLKKYISQSTMTGIKENEKISIPIHSIDIPNFRFGKGEGEQGVGSGGEQGVDEKNGPPGEGQQAGNESGEHVFETEFTINELAQILGEHLQLPEMKPKGNNNVEVSSKKYSSLSNVGPDGLRQFKNTYKKALKKSLSEGTYNPKNPMVIPNRRDYIFKAPKLTHKPNAQAVVFYIMDISGSMGEPEKKVVQNSVFWINAWIRKHYKGLESRFVVHEARAWEVKEQEFFTISASGGTLISSSYACCLDIIKKEYNPNEWNIYIFQFSDGDNWSGEDTNKCFQLLTNELLPISNLFCFGQVESKYGSGEFIRSLHRQFGEANDKLKSSLIKGSDGILDAIKKFLGK